MSVHIVDVSRQHSRNFSVLAVNALGSDRGVVRLTVAPVPAIHGESSSHQHHPAGLDNEVDVAVSRAAESTRPWERPWESTLRPSSSRVPPSLSPWVAEATLRPSATPSTPPSTTTMSLTSSTTSTAVSK